MEKFKSVIVDKDKCTGCRVCEYVCSIYHPCVFNPSRSHIKVTRVYPFTNAALTCRMCDDAPCVPACPRKALTQSPENGVILVDDELCNEPGCDKCIKACEYGSITLEAGKARMCDLCAKREEGPACIEWCPEEVLSLEFSEDEKKAEAKSEVAEEA